MIEKTESVLNIKGIVIVSDIEMMMKELVELRKCHNRPLEEPSKIQVPINSKPLRPTHLSISSQLCGNRVEIVFRQSVKREGVGSQ